MNKQIPTREADGGSSLAPVPTSPSEDHSEVIATAVRRAIADALGTPAPTPVGVGHGPIMLSVADACAELRCGKTKLHELIRDGRIRTCTVGRRRLIARSDLEAFVEALRAELQP